MKIARLSFFQNFWDFFNFSSFLKFKIGEFFLDDEIHRSYHPLFDHYCSIPAASLEYSTT